MTTEEPHRAGEIASDGALPIDAGLAFIGRIETPWRSRWACPRQGDCAEGPVCRLIVDTRWIPALEGIDEQSTLQILYWMHEARRDLVLLSPRGGARRGPFALRAPTRPNPIASSIVTMVGREGGVLDVRGLDCLDGTPLLDIKPWRGC
jgi:tRNA-Thr(GGU) m(6)t(6)A37 methyltransferase TsaA